MPFPGKNVYALARYDTSGALDPTFGTGGKVTSDLGGTARSFAAAFGCTGSVIAVGQYNVPFDSNNQFAVASFHADGAAGSCGSCTLACTEDIEVSGDAGACGAVVNYTEPTVGDSCGEVTCSKPSGDFFPVGETLVTCSEPGPGGESCSFTVTVNDTEDPSVNAPPNITQGADAGACSATLDPGAATAADNCSIASVSGVRSDAQPLNAPYPKGATSIVWTATDASGRTAAATQTVTINDTENPTVNAPADITAASDAGSCSADVNPGTATAVDNCGGVGVAGARSDSQPLGAAYPVGTTTITWTATDAAGNTATDTQTVTVGDAHAPTISGLGVSPTQLWPPNHKMRDVAVSYSVSDNCSAAAQLTCVLSVSSNQPVNDVGDGNTAPDWEIVGAQHVRLRAERSQGQTRVYTITLTCTDAYGNASSKSATVSVTH
jgi:hypothetical protein